MKLAVLWHLTWVLLIILALEAVVRCEETATSASTTTAARAPAGFVARERKLPRLDHVNGLKKPPPKSEILVQHQQQNPPDDSTSTTARSFRTDYLAKNTVPVAVAPTEATRKFTRSRLVPGPSPALLAFKAASGSTTERGFDSSIPPTGWALAALGPSSSSASKTPGFGKRFSSPSTIVKPISTFWSTRLFKSTTPSSFSETPEVDEERNNVTTIGIPSNSEATTDESFIPQTTATTRTITTTTSTTSAPSTTVTTASETEKATPFINTTTESVKNLESTEFPNSSVTTTTTTPSTTTSATSNTTNPAPGSTVPEDNLIKSIPFASNEINLTTTRTNTTTTQAPFVNKPEENTIATPVTKSKHVLEPVKIEEPVVLATKSKISGDDDNQTRAKTEEPIVTSTMKAEGIVSETEIPVVVTTQLEEMASTTDQTLTTIAKSNSTSKTISENETKTEDSESQATTTVMPSSTLSNDIPDFAKSGKLAPSVMNSTTTTTTRPLTTQPQSTTVKTENTDNNIPVSTPSVQTVDSYSNAVNQSTVPPLVVNSTVENSNVTTAVVQSSTEPINHSKNEIKSLDVNNKIDRATQSPVTTTSTKTTESSSSIPVTVHTNLSNFHYDLDNKTETPAVILNEGGGGSDEDDDSLKYNVTHHDDHDDYDDLDQSVTSISADPVANVTSTSIPPFLNGTSAPTVTTTTSSSTPVDDTITTSVSIVSVSETTTYVFDHTIPGEDEDDDESVIVPMNVRVHIQASYKQMCLFKEQFRNTVVSALSEETTKPVERDQVEILNLGPNECDGLMSTDGDVIPVTLLLMTPQGKYDKALTEMLFTLIKHSRFNFKYPITQVDKLVSQMLEPPVHQMGPTVIAAIIISSIAGVCLLFLTILLVIMRKRQKGFNYGQRCTPVSLDDYSLDNISVYNSVRRKAMRASKRSYGNPAFDDPVALTNPLNFAGLSNALSDRSKIEEEFDRVPTVSVKPDELPLGAESKNRYANVIPLPETRVQLNGPSTNSTGNDVADHFINANYVKGAKGGDKFYIACQAPLQNTVADFWQMIWEQQSRVIIMLTDLHENGAEKSADYLPPSEVLDCHRVFGDLQVTLKKREVRDKYVISSLQLKNLVSSLWREVTHLWYSGWPTSGVPQDCSSMIAFLIEARSYSKAGPPIVVHCSPGTGRTGTVIAIDTAIRDFETDRSVDIPKTVYSIRRDRAGAVQTSQQYLFIHQVLHLYATKLAGGGLDSI